MICSATALSAKAISATTVGLVLVKRHDNIPLTPFSSNVSACIACSMSAAVVPGAKLLAITMEGPAFPFMLSPLPLIFRCEGIILASEESRAEAMRADRPFCRTFADEGREGVEELFLEEVVLAIEDDRLLNGLALVMRLARSGVRLEFLLLVLLEFGWFALLRPKISVARASFFLR
jgi:hypothetical protein